jgi:hypothetical protein
MRGPIKAIIATANVRVACSGARQSSLSRAVAPLAQKKFSIILDTRALEEQYYFAVSLFGAKLPLLSPFEVSVKDKLRIERHRGRTD